MRLVNGLRFDNLKGDIYGGLTAAVVALPLALAFGVSSGAGPVAGLYGAICVGFFAALFGGTPSQVSGPTGPMTVVMATVLMQYTAMFPDDPARGFAIAFTVVMMGGAFQIVFGVLRLGNYINMMPHPVTSGFMSGIGVIIILLQIEPLLGYPALSGPLESLRALPELMGQPPGAAAAVGVGTLAIVYLMPARINRIVPAPLVALVAGALVLRFWSPDSDVPVLGEIPAGLPALQMPTVTLALLPDMIKSAVVLAVLGSIDSLLTSLVADNVTRTYHRSDRELVGQGIGNMVAGLFGGLPGAGATMRTVVNVKAGGRTPISGALHAAVLLILVLGAGGLASGIPHAVLAGILIKVGTDIIDWDYLRRLRTAPPVGVLVMFTVLLITVFIDLITAVATGVVMASFIFLKRMTDLQLEHAKPMRGAGDHASLSAEEVKILDDAGGRILLYHLSGPLSFSSAKGVARKLADFDEYDVLLLDLSDVTQIDYTSSRAVGDMIADGQARGRVVLLVLRAGDVDNLLAKYGVRGSVDDGQIFTSRLEALRSAASVGDAAPDAVRADR